MFTMTRFVAALTAVWLFVALAGPAAAQVTTDPYLFEAPFTSPTGTFEWDTFSGSFAGPHTPDVTSAGTGSGSLDGSGVTTPPFTFPAPLVTTTGNLYSGEGAGTFAIDLASLDQTGAFTTVVMQLAYVEGDTPYTNLALDGAAPTEFVNRGTATVTHGDGVLTTGSSPFPTTYWWAEWQLEAGSSHQITFDTATHTSLGAVRIDYLNSAATTDALTPSAVPEPASLVLLGLGGLAALTRRRRG